MYKNVKSILSKLSIFVRKSLSDPRSRVISFVVLFATIGTVALLLTNAATPAVGVEAESGATSGNASKVIGAAANGASGSGYVKFGSVPPAAITPYDIPDTSGYTEPAGAKYVAPTGTDSATCGAKSSPCRTITQAVGNSSAGTTILLRAGTYREKVPKLTKALNFQAYPSEKPWMDGSVDISAGYNGNPWAASGATWQMSNWNPSLCYNRLTCVGRVKHYNASGTQDGFEYVDSLVTTTDGLTPLNGSVPDNPVAALPDMVFVNGVQAQQVTSRAAVSAGKFFVDTANGQLVIGDNPATKTIEASVHDNALWAAGSPAAAINVKGVGFRRYATAPNNTISLAALVATGANSVIEDSVFLYNASAGFIANNSNLLVKNTVSAYNGWKGANLNGTHNSTIQNSTFAYNNMEDFQRQGAASAAGGLKITNGNNVKVIGSTFDSNEANGLWYDVGNTNATIVNNLVKNNARNGIFFEISGTNSNGGDTNIIASNRVVGNVQDTLRDNKFYFSAGIKTSSSTNVYIFNNTLYQNYGSISSYFDGRYTNTCPAQDTTCFMGNYHIVNNVISDHKTVSASASRGIIDVQNTKNGAANVGSWFGAINGSTYHRPSSTPANLVKFNGTLYTTVIAFRATGFEAVGDETASGVLANPSAGNYVLGSGLASNLINGVPLPANIAGAIGVAAGGTGIGYLR